MKFRKTIFIFLTIAVLSFLFCSSATEVYIKPLIKNTKTLILEYNTNQKMILGGEEVRSQNQSTVRMQVLSGKINSTLLKVSFDKYDVSSNIGGRLPVTLFNDVKYVSFNLNVDTDGALEITETNIPMNSSLTRDDVQSSIEQMIGLIVKGFPENTIELKEYWNSEFTIPITIEKSSNATKTYFMNYKFDKIDSKSEIVELILNGGIEIKGENLSTSYGTLKGIIMFNIRKGFATRLNVDEKYEIQISNDEENYPPIVIEQNILINTKLN